MNISSSPGSKVNSVKDLLDQHAAVIDVRTPAEYMGGHVAGSINVPLSTIRDRIADIKEMNQPIILCCASGGRSGQATTFLKQEGVVCENGGGWVQLNGLVNS